MGLFIATGLAALVPAACSGQAGGPGGPSFALTVAPLSLPGVSYVCYDLAITGPTGPVASFGVPGLAYAAGDTDAICSWQYGNGDGGDIAYVAPCDADDGDGDSPARATNTVTLWFDGLYRSASGHAPADAVDVGAWQDPCPDGCSLEVECSENRDARVAFDFTILRQANQGFFDIGVNFDDIFCSAKLDCLPALLNDPSHGGARGQSAVVAFACTAGEGQQTTLYMDDLRVECAGPPARTFYVDPSRGAGQHGPLPADAPVLFETATYFGREQLPGLDKCYWNNALGLDVAALGPGCTLYGRATAAAAPFGGAPHTTPAHTSYPVVTFAVPLTDATSALVCDDAPHPLNGGNGVATAYGPIDGERFTHAMACGGEPHDTGRTQCTTPLAGQTAMTFTQTGDGVVVRVGDSASAPFDLGPGLSVDSCCGDPCCR
ncbi:MAG: hypothetical protein U1F43_11295 [Myxococcota bacterium]